MEWGRTSGFARNASHIPGGDPMGAWSFKELLRHAGHKIVCVTYGTQDEVWNVAIECQTCMEVLFDYDRDEE
jgi:hypothetical protein